MTPQFTKNKARFFRASVINVRFRGRRGSKAVNRNSVKDFLQIAYLYPMFNLHEDPVPYDELLLQWRSPKTPESLI